MCIGRGIAEALERPRKGAVRWAKLFLLNAYANHEKGRLVADVFRARLISYYAPEEIERLLVEAHDEARARGLLPDA